MAWNDKKLCLSQSISQEPYIIWFLFLVHLCKILISPVAFFHFFKSLILQVFRWVKGQKMVQNDKKLCLSCCISQELYIIWLLFVVHCSKMMISPSVFFHFFKILIFQVVSEVKGQKIPQNDKNFLLHSISQEVYIIWLLFLVHMFKLMTSPDAVFIFSKFFW